MKSTIAGLCFIAATFTPPVLGAPKAFEHAAYVIDVIGSVQASPWNERHLAEIYPGAMLEPSVQLTFRRGAQLTLFCNKNTSLQRVSSAQEMQETCFKHTRQLDNMRSSSSTNAPILVSPRQKTILDFTNITWRSDVAGKFMIELTKLDGDNNPVIFRETPDKIQSHQRIHTTYAYTLPATITQLLEADQAYRLIIQNLTNGESSEQDDYAGVFEIASAKDKSQHRKQAASFAKQADDSTTARYLEAMFYKDQGFYRESLQILDALSPKLSKNNPLATSIQLQIADIYLRQDSKADYITIPLLKAITSSGETSNQFDGYLACDRLALILGRLDNRWLNIVEQQFSKPGFQKNCPLLAAD